MELSELHGVGPSRLSALKKAGVCSIDDLLSIFPVGYRDTTIITPVSQLKEKQPCCIQGWLKSAPQLSRFHGITRVTATFRDTTGSIPLVWYNQPWIAKQLSAENDYLFTGIPTRDKNGRLIINSPHRETQQAILPIYRVPESIPTAAFEKWIDLILRNEETLIQETLPSAVRKRFELCEKNYAVRQLHKPSDRACLAVAQRRMAFEHLLLYQTAFSLLRSRPGKSRAIIVSDEIADTFWHSLPFSPTKAQLRVFDEIRNDLTSTTAMRRLVQGDVGSGKTAVIFAAAYCCAKAGFQCALMAPTEVLARQHLESAQMMLEPLGVHCGLLLGGMKARERRDALSAISSGAWQLVMGTHALLNENVDFQSLALAVTDEQHRFGVHQRHMLAKHAGEQFEPHILVASATPIPRSLTLVLYGDLSISILDEMPPGRTPVKTHIVPESKRNSMYEFIRKQAEAGKQTYIVCPLVEESETTEAKNVLDMYAYLCNGPLSGLSLGLTYGSQPVSEKASMLQSFSSGKIDILVSTTVIEVGVNVPNASVMVIENADRFGLSQLHQLRGRVGRGSQESWCFLMAEPNERLNTLCSTNDGFEVAQKDLELRGPGELLGTAQHGSDVFAMLAADTKLIAETQECLHWLNRSPDHLEEWEIVRNAARLLFEHQLAQVTLD